MSKSQNNAIVDKLLTGVSQAYIPDGFIAESLFPGISVVQTTGKLGTYGKQHLRIVNTVMGGKGRAPRVDSIVRSSLGYDVERHGLESEVSPDDYRNVEEPFDAEADEVTGLTTLLQIGKEKALADALGNTSVLTQNTTLAGTAQFNDYTNSNPLNVFKNAFAAVKTGCGKFPNAAVVPALVLNTLKYHPAILEALGFKEERAGMLSAQDIAKAMGVDQLFVPDASYNSAADGQTASLAEIWGKDIVFLVRPKKAEKYQTSLGYYITLKGEGPRKVYKYPVYNPPGSQGIIITDHYDQLIADAGAGYLVKSAIA